LTAPPAATEEAIVASGGLIRLFEVKVMDGITFYHKIIVDKAFRNPRLEAAARGEYVHVQGRRFILMRTESDHGQVEYGTLDADGYFVPNAPVVNTGTAAAG
jgi:hypothetical protein